MMASERPDDRTAAQGDRARAAAAGNFALIDALLNVSGDAPSFAPLFRAARVVCAFDRAMVLQEDGDSLHCMAADPEQQADRRWPASAPLARAMRSRGLVLAGNKASDDRALLPRDLVLPGEPAVLLPIAV